MARDKTNTAAGAGTLLDEQEPPAKPVTESITYTPGGMDPPTVKWCGHTFQANVAKEITGHPEGTASERLNHTLIESARNNRHFMVGNAKPKRDPRTTPTTAEEYRRYMVAWLNEPFDSADQLIARFAKDRDLRAACEVGFDDYAYLKTLFMPKLHELARADELNEAQIASTWIANGFNEQPW